MSEPRRMMVRFTDPGFPSNCPRCGIKAEVGEALEPVDVTRTGRFALRLMPCGHVIPVLFEVVEPECWACRHPVSDHYGRWCRAPRGGAINRDGQHLICCCEAADSEAGILIPETIKASSADS